MNTLDVNYILELTDIYKQSHTTAAGYRFFSTAHGTFSRIDYMLGHKASLSKFKKFEIRFSKMAAE